MNPNRSLARSVAVACAGLLLAALPIHAQVPPQNFGVEDVLLGLEQPTAIRFLPDGRMLVLLKQGEMRIADVSTAPATATTYMDLRDPSHVDGVQGDQERGLLDVTFDPEFPAEPYLYLFYTPANGSARISRFTHAENGGGLGSQGIASSEVVLWQDTDGYDSCCHYGGGLNFGPDGNLWLTTGDHFQGSYAASLEHGGGGVIRIAKDGSIPADNPFADGIGPQVDAKFAYGLRNPFRSRWDLPTGRFLIAEVGGNTQMVAWEDLHVLRYDLATGRFVDGDFGTTNDNGVFDGLDFGWPTVEGLPPHTDFPAASIQPIAEPIFGYPHAGVFSSITGGVVYRGDSFPEEFVGAYFYGDSTRDFIRYLKFNPDGTVAPNPSPDPLGVKTPDPISHPFDLFPIGQVVYLDVGPDGALYYVSFNDAGGSAQVPPENGSIRRYVYALGNQLPVVEFSATPQVGLAPLNVAFSVQATDPEAMPLSFTLDFGNGQIHGPAPLEAGVPVQVPYTFLDDGAYDCVLEVTDSLQVVSRTLTVRVGNPPLITQLISTNSRPGGSDDIFQYGDVMTFAAQATDAEDGVLPGENFTWSISFIRPAASHPAFGPESGSTSIDFPIPAQGQGFSGPVFYRCFLKVRDSSGLTTSETIDIFPDKVDIDFASIPDGISIQVNGNTTRLTPFTLDTLINYDHVITAPQSRCLGGILYEFAGWSNGPTTPQQFYVAPSVNSALTAMYTAVGPCSGPPTDGLVLRLDATAGVVTDGSVVTEWHDQTSSGNDLTAAGNPLLLPGEFNGQDAIHFDGLDASLGRTGFTALPIGSAERSVFMVGRYNEANPSGPGWAGFAYGTAVSNGAFGLALTPTGILGVQGWGSADFPSSPPTNGVGGLLSHSAVYQGSLLTQYLIGAPIGNRNHFFGTGTTGIRLGEELTGGKNLDMDVAEVLVYDRAVTETERAGIEAYFEERYLITTGGGNPPTVRMLTPENGSYVFTFELPLAFQATATDFEDGDLGAGITWWSSLDGVLGTGKNISAALSEGTHLIVARAEDSSMLASTDEVELIVTSNFDDLITAGLVLHLEADQGVTLASGSTVAGWQDASSFGNHLLAGGEPQWVEGSTPSGKPSIQLDGDGDLLERLHASAPLGGLPVGNANRTLFMLARYQGSSAWAGMSYGTPATNQAFGLTVQHPSGELVLQGYGSADIVSVTPGIGAGWLVQSSTLKNGSAKLFRDGELIAQSPHIYDTLLSRLVIGGELGGLGFVSADVAAVLVYNRALSNAERALVEDYLYAKYLAPNTQPIVTIKAPADGSSHVEGVPIQCIGLALDKQDGDLGASLAWSSDVDGALGTGAALQVSTLTVGAHVITASVTDAGLLEGSASVMVTVLPNTPPVVAISLPADFATYGQGVAVPFSATAADAEDGDLGASIAWSSDLDGALGTGASLSLTTLSLGTHVITASVTDTSSVLGAASVTLNVVPNLAPVVVISAPADGSSSVQGVAVSLAATAQDDADGDLGASIAWSSSLDGALGTGASLQIATLSLGTHVLTAAVTDSGQLEGTASVTLDVVPNTTPGVTISAPADGASFLSGVQVLFTGSATDAEDGDLSASIAWSSDLDGALGSGASLQVATLSLGLHVITASVSDSLGAVASASIEIRVKVPAVLPAGLVLQLETTQGIGARGSGLSTWSDLSGNGNHLTASGGPVLAPALTPSGRPAIVLDGLDDKFERLDAEDPIVGLPEGNADRTMFLVARYNGLTWSSGVAYGTGSSNAAFGLGLRHPAGLLMLQGFGYENDLVSSTSALGKGWLVQGGMLEDGNATLFDGLKPLAQWSHTYATQRSKIVIGEEITGLGSTAMDLAAVLVFDRALSPLEFLSVNAYLEQKYLIPNDAPTVSIVAPADGAVFDQGQTVSFAASASDEEDGELSDAITWTSSLDGALGSGGAFDLQTLSLGTHVITASVIDSGGSQGQASVTLTIERHKLRRRSL